MAIHTGRVTHQAPTGRRKPQLDPDTRAALHRLAALPDGPARTRLREEIVCAWLPMAHRLARRYSGRGESDEDLRQVAALGLLKAIDRFDPGVGTAFGAFAVPTIIGEIKRHFRDELWAVHVPRRAQELRAQVHRARLELSVRPGHATITPQDVAAHTGMPYEDVLIGLDAQKTFTALSLERPLGGEDTQQTLGDLLGQEDPALGLVDDREAAAIGLRTLPERERHILYLRFYLGLTQSEIADRVGVSQMHVSRLLRRSCAYVREKALAPTP